MRPPMLNPLFAPLSALPGIGPKLEKHYARLIGRDGQAPRVHSVDEPAPTICAQGRIQLAQAVVVGRDIDVLFRMLDPRRELARAMSFSDEDAEYMFAGTKTDITKQVGNAVPVRTATALVGAMIDV